MTRTRNTHTTTGTVPPSALSRFLAWLRGRFDSPPSNERLAELLTITYDRLPRLAEAFLLEAQKAGLVFDLREKLLTHAVIAFDGARITFSHCDPSRRSTRALALKSNQLDFQLWFEVENMVSLRLAETNVYSFPTPRAGEAGVGPSGDTAAFLDVARFVSELTPTTYGRVLRVE